MFMLFFSVQTCLQISMSTGQQLSLWGSYGNPQPVFNDKLGKADPHKTKKLCESRSDTNCLVKQVQKKKKCC